MVIGDLRAPTIISTFAGCGGSSLGYRMAGYKELLAIEWDGKAVETFLLNFLEVPIWQKDIRLVSAEEILDFCGIEVGELDLLDGSPPCQGFSKAGRQCVSDSRNILFVEFARLLRGLQPKVFVMENVDNIVRGRMKGVFKDIMLALKDCGYVVKCRLMNTEWYGVPQRRRRLIWVGARNDLNVNPSYPIPQSLSITVRDALRGLLIQSQFKALSERKQKLYHATKRGDDLSGAALKILGKKNNSFTYRRLAWDKPSPTICASSGGILHPDECRLLTIAELKRLSSFPDWFQFIGSFSRQWLLIGNSVPPLFMRAIAEHIRKNILDFAGKRVVKVDG